MYIVYTKEKISKEVFNVNLDSKDLEIVMGGNVFLDHPELNPEDYIISNEKFEYPTYNVKTNTIEEMTLYERYKNSLYELLPNQVEYEETIITLEPGQFINLQGKLETIPKIEGTRIEWNWETHQWEEKASELEMVQFQYKEYEGMDTPSTLEEMKQQDPALVTEYINMMIELRSLIYTLSVSDVQPVSRYAFPTIPIPSKELKEFKNKFKLTK